jgi:ppGpp synthetase/RelA/SpoT-type nucleotidyltranferase
MEFKSFLLTEQKDYLANRVNDVLTGVHELLAAKKQMGAKQMVRNAEDVANQIRKILHNSWARSEHKYLKVLQKCGVALMRAIEEKGDLSDVFNSVRSELEKLSHKLRVPANKLGTGKEEAPRRPEPAPPGQTPQSSPEPLNQQDGGASGI